MTQTVYSQPITQPVEDEAVDCPWVVEGMCQICGERPATYVDHDHDTGLIRGNLCPRCNTLAQHPDLLRKALAWVENPPAGTPHFNLWRIWRATHWNSRNPERRRELALESYHRTKGEVREYQRTGIEAADLTEYKREYMRQARMVMREAEGLPPALHNRDKMICKNGHPFNEENTIMRPGGGRACRACNRAKAAAHRATRKRVAP